MCRNSVDKNSNLLDLLKKVDSVRERFNVVAVNLIEKNQTTVTEKQSQRGGDCDRREDVAGVQNPVKIRVVFSTSDFVLITSNRDQETQTSEEILESLDASSVTVINKVYFDTLYF